MGADEMVYVQSEDEKSVGDCVLAIAAQICALRCLLSIPWSFAFPAAAPGVLLVLASSSHVLSLWLCLCLYQPLSASSPSPSAARAAQSPAAAERPISSDWARQKAAAGVKVQGEATTGPGHDKEEKKVGT